MESETQKGPQKTQTQTQTQKKEEKQKGLSGWAIFFIILAIILVLCLIAYAIQTYRARVKEKWLEFLQAANFYLVYYHTPVAIVSLYDEYSDTSQIIPYHITVRFQSNDSYMYDFQDIYFSKNKITGKTVDVNNKTVNLEIREELDGNIYMKIMSETMVDEYIYSSEFLPPNSGITIPVFENIEQWEEWFDTFPILSYFVSADSIDNGKYYYEIGPDSLYGYTFTMQDEYNTMSRKYALTEAANIDGGSVPISVNGQYAPWDIGIDGNLVSSEKLMPKNNYFQGKITNVQDTGNVLTVEIYQQSSSELYGTPYVFQWILKVFEADGSISWYTKCTQFDNCGRECSNALDRPYFGYRDCCVGNTEYDYCGRSCKTNPFYGKNCQYEYDDCGRPYYTDENFSVVNPYFGLPCCGNSTNEANMPINPVTGLNQCMKFYIGFYDAYNLYKYFYLYADPESGYLYGVPEGENSNKTLFTVRQNYQMPNSCLYTPRLLSGNSYQLCGVTEGGEYLGDLCFCSRTNDIHKICQCQLDENVEYDENGNVVYKCDENKCSDIWLNQIGDGLSLYLNKNNTACTIKEGFNEYGYSDVFIYGRLNGSNVNTNTCIQSFDAASPEKWEIYTNIKLPSSSNPNACIYYHYENNINQIRVRDCSKRGNNHSNIFFLKYV